MTLYKSPKLWFPDANVLFAMIFTKLVSLIIKKCFSWPSMTEVKHISYANEEWMLTSELVYFMACWKHKEMLIAQSDPKSLHLPTWHRADLPHWEWRSTAELAGWGSIEMQTPGERQEHQLKQSLLLSSVDLFSVAWSVGCRLLGIACLEDNF